MESPVRICLGAALVVNILLLSGTIVSGNVIPNDLSSTTVSDERPSRLNATWLVRNRHKNPDVSLNELNPKDTTSEEHTEKNAKYKDRGRVRFHSQLKSSTGSPLRRATSSSSETPSLVIVTPTAEVKKPAEIVDSMRNYKKTKLPSFSSSTTPMSVTIVNKEEYKKEEFEDDEDEEESDSFEKFASSKFDDHFFSIPSFNYGSDFNHDSDNESADNKVKSEYSSPSYGGFSSFFPREASYAYKDTTHDVYKSESFFDFDSDLTTPKNDFFDSKFKKISTGIIKNLDTIKAKVSPPPNTTNILITENLGLDKLNNNTPGNKSTVFIKNTKEIRLLDNDGAGSANEQLSDVQGTSIYYEMSVLSTETYAINHSDDDCDNESLPPGPTPSTSAEDELASVKDKQLLPPLTTKSLPPPVATRSLPPPVATRSLPPPVSTRSLPPPVATRSLPPPVATRSLPPPVATRSLPPPVATRSLPPPVATRSIPPSVATRPTLPDPSIESLSVSPASFLPLSTIFPPVISTVIPVSTQNSVSSTERTKLYSSNFSRNRNYSKRLNFNSNKDSPNSVTPKPEIFSSTLRPRLQTRHPTPKIRPVWMTPRNITKVYMRPTYPTTIYSEHFSLRPPRPRLPSKTSLSTVSSDIDPVKQSEISGTKKVVYSESFSDNTVPSLWKRGSTRFTTTTATSTEVETESEWQIPPTSTAWALASLRSPPPSPGAIINGTGSLQKNIDENELQKVGEVLEAETTAKEDEAKEILATSSTTTTLSPINNDIIPKKVTEVVQNKLFTQLITPTLSSTEILTEAQTEVKSERLPTESDIYVQNSSKPTTTETTISENIMENETEASWVPITADETTNQQNDIEDETIPPDTPTKRNRFESITKLPGDVTTPQDESFAGSEVNHTVVLNQIKTTSDYDITTIRFSYVPTEEMETETQTVDTTVPSTWHPVFPTRTKTTTIKDSPITTYRPKYLTTESEEESTTIITENTSPIEVSSQILENTTILIADTTEMPVETTASPTEIPTTTEVITEIATEIQDITTQPQPSTTKITTTQPTSTPTTQPTTVTIQTTTYQAPTSTPTTEIVEDTTTIIVEIHTEINTEREQRIISTTDLPITTETTPSELHDPDSSDCTEENSSSNEVVTQETTTIEFTTTETLTTKPTIITTTEILPKITEPPVTEVVVETTTQRNAKIHDTTPAETTTDSEYMTRVIAGDDASSYAGEVTTEASTRTMGGDEDSGSGAAVAIAVSTIGVIALVLLIGLLLVVRRRGRRGVYAQRCTPVSLDAYSLDSVSVGHRKGNHRLRASKRSYGNPAYDDEVTSHPMHYAALANFAQDIESMTAEFSEIPTVTVRPDEVPPGCEDKNRYSNVLPLPETRVPLQRLGNDPTTEYINANYVTGPGNIRNYYIACQAPLSNTVVDFWRMIWEQNSRVIVMLTEYMENGVEKCYEYLPPSEVSDNKRIFGDFKIILKKREQRDKYAVSSVQLINMTTRTWREITHLWYFWPAKGVPDDYDSVIDFLCEMRSYMKMSQTAKEYDEDGVEVIYGDQNRSSFSNLSKLRSDEGGSGNGINVYSPARAEEQLRRATPTNGTLGRMKVASEVDGIRPLVVTCASGAGRSGALLALDVCARAPPAPPDVPRAVRSLRAQRPHSLSNRHHYIFVYKVLSEYGNKMLGGGVDTI